MKPLCIAALLALACAPALAETKPASKKSWEKTPQVCFTEPATGSHIRKRTCMSEKEYEARRKRDQEAMSNLRDKPTALSQGR